MTLTKNILVVEDEPDIRRDLVAVLEGKGYVVHSAANGRDALAHLRTYPAPSVILLDLRMPIMDGCRFREQQRRDPVLAGIPVVVLSALGDAASEDDALGDVGYLQKPFEVEELVAAVERFATVPKPEVLVVEDEPAVLKMLDVALRHYGFSVLQAGGGKEALRLFAQHRDTIDVVLLDVQMPDMDGPQTLAALRKLDPNLSCCFMSANVGKYAETNLVELGAAHVLGKPFSSIADLARTLWEVATARSAAQKGH